MAVKACMAVECRAPWVVTKVITVTKDTTAVTKVTKLTTTTKATKVITPLWDTLRPKQRALQILIPLPFLPSPLNLAMRLPPQALLLRLRSWA